MSDLYMGGRGINKRTRELCDDLWDALPSAFIGSSIALFSCIAATIGVILGEAVVQIAAIIIGIPIMLAGVWLAMPWFEARERLVNHRLRLAAETDRLGRGWARD